MKGITNLSGSVGIVEFDEFCEEADVEKLRTVTVADGGQDDA